MAINSYEGLKNYDSNYSDLFRVFGAKQSSFFWQFKMFNFAPFGFAGLKLSATFSVIGAIVAEFVGSDKGLGYGMLQASYSLNTPRLFVYLLVSCALGLIMYSIVAVVERVFFSKYGGRWALEWLCLTSNDSRVGLSSIFQLAEIASSTRDGFNQLLSLTFPQSCSGTSRNSNAY